MWTYMMAAARGDRANTMMSSRRRNESESPKYGYNLSRPMYRTRRLHRPAANLTGGTSSADGSSNYGLYSGTNQYRSGHVGGIDEATIRPTTSSAHIFEASRTDESGNVVGSVCSLSGAAGASAAGGGGHSAGLIEEGCTSLFSPLAPATIISDKDVSIFSSRDSGGSAAAAAAGCMMRKQLIANHISGTTTNATIVRIPTMHDSDNDEAGTTDASNANAMLQRQQRQTKFELQHNDIIDSDTDVDDDDDDDDDVDDDDEDGRAGGKAAADKLQNLENGKHTQDQTKRSKPSALRRTLNALRQRLTKRNRSKPPDWFLEKFSNTTNKDKIGKVNELSEVEAPNGASRTTSNATDVALASEIRGTSRLCNRLSVNPTLKSHYRWLAIVSLAVLYNIIFVLGRAVFWEINQRATSVWYFLDYLCDFIYLVDTLVHMHEGYLDQGLLVRDAYKLRRNYFSHKGWFIDLLSMLPTDLSYIWWPPSSCGSTSLPCSVIVRLNRLLRVPRMLEWFDRTETATGYPNAFRICKVVLAILVLIHWNACFFFAISYYLGFNSDNWVYNINGERNATLQRQYIYSFYWSTLTLTTIGETPTPENDAEYLFVVLDFLAGVLIFATIVGNIGSMISNMNVARVEFQNRMDGVKQYMAFRKVGHELEARVIRWFAYTWSQSGALDEERVLAALPDKLKAEIAIQVHMDTLKQVRIFHDCEPGLLEALVLKLKLQVFSPGDYICRKGDVGKEMYIVKRGKLSVVGDDGVTVLATLGAGSVFGEVSVLEIAGNRTGNRRTANVRSLGYSDLFCLAKRDLWETLADYPEARATLTERGCQLLRKDGLLDEQVFSDSQRSNDSIEGGIEKLEVSVENLNMRLARLLAEYTASQLKLKQRMAKLEFNYQLTHASAATLSQTRARTGRNYSLQPKKRTRPRSSSTTKSTENKQNTL